MRDRSLTLLLALFSACSHPSQTPATFVPGNDQPVASFATLGSRVAELAAMYPQAAHEGAAQAPMSLTASDGTGLELVALEGRAVVQGPLAFTELHLSFRNPESRVREGRFSITLPSSAAVSRFAMKLPSGWQEAEVVERQAARQIYEDFLHRRQDPALLEKKAGNQFRARVFPIPANSIKEIKLSYSQQLQSKGEPYRLYLKGLPKMQRLELSALVSQRVEGQRTASSLGGVAVAQKVVRLSRSGQVPAEDFIVQPDSSIAGLGYENLALVRVKPELPGERAPMESLMVLVDTSASRAAGFANQVTQVGALLAQLKASYGADVPLHVACFDQDVQSVFQGRLGGFSSEQMRMILARRPLGASDLGRALSWTRRTRGYRRLVLVTDGIATAGGTDGAELQRAVEGLRGAGTQRLDVVLVGGIRDEAGMRKLVAGALERDGVVLDGDKPATALAQRLSRRAVSGIEVQVPGARWTWPRRLDSVQPGDERLVFADLDRSITGRALTVQLSGPVSHTQRVTLASVAPPLLRRAWAEARIAHLQHRHDTAELDPDLSGAVKKQIVDLSIKHRVLSDYTALLVLETEADYARYGIKRDALADVLVVGPTGVELMQRGATVVQPVNSVPPAPLRRRPVRDLDDSVGAMARHADEADAAVQSEAEGAPVEATAPPPAPPASVSAPSAPSAQPRGPLAKRRTMVARPRRAPAPVRDEARLAAPAENRAVSGGERRARVAAPPRRPAQVASEAKQKDQRPAALSGRLAQIMELIEAGNVEAALVEALRWLTEQPGDVLALVALGEALQAAGHQALAARVYGSIIDLFPSRADMRRFAGEQLDALGRAGSALAVDTYRQAVVQRPDHQSGHRLLAFALLRRGHYEQALSALEAGLDQSYRIARRGFERILREDMGLVAAAWLAHKPGQREAIAQRLAARGGTIADRPSLRFVISWETDANDLDFHIHDGNGGHAYYSHKQLPSGGALYADVTNGFGPECFTIEGRPQAYPYRLEAHYYSRGPMGYGMGKLQVIEHDGKGGLRFVERPFVVMNDRAFVDLGEIKGPLL